MRGTVVITGVAGGIGSAIAKTFKQNGYYVVGLDINTGSITDCDIALPADLDKYCRDAGYRSDMEALMELKVPGINVLINNAAVQVLDSISEIDLEDWNRTMNVNLTAPLLLTRFFFKKLEAAAGAVINIASIHHQLTKKRFLAYATSKAALVGMTKAMSVDFNGKVRVNAISPAAIDTRMLRDGFDHDEDKVQQLYEIHPLQRIGRPEEVAELALLLSDSNRLGFINGANIELDGGISNVLRDLE